MLCLFVPVAWKPVFRSKAYDAAAMEGGSKPALEVATVDASGGFRLSGPGFAEALQNLSAAFSKTKGIKLETLGYRSGILDLQLRAPDVNALDKLRQQIDNSGVYIASIQSANPDKEAIKGRMQTTAVQP